MTRFWTRAGQGAGSGSASIGEPGIVGFISAAALVFNPGAITAQKDAIDAAAGSAGLKVDAYLVELSPRRPGEPWSPAVRDLVLVARAGRLGGVVLDRVERLAADRDDALLVAVTLIGSRVRIIEGDRGATVAGPRLAAPRLADRAGRRRRAPWRLVEVAS